jgi:hypothetical protein
VQDIKISSCGFLVVGFPYLLKNVQKEFLEDIVLEENHGLPCFLFGHSTGGAIVLKVE